MKTINYNQLKKEGFIRQVQKDRFALRFKVTGGRLSAEHLKKIYEIAEKYGEQYVHMTSRQSIEIPFIKLKDIEKIKEELELVNLKTCACGPVVRTITACQGNAVCSSGLIDTADIAKEFEEKYYGRELPHKFKLGVTGCRNNCLKAEENDLGVKGAMDTTWKADDCIYCGLCQGVCPAKVIAVDKKAKTLTFDKDNCLYCGKCVKVCPKKAWTGKSGYRIYFGGLFGNKIMTGEQFLPIIYSKDELHTIVEATLKFFMEHGNTKERFGNTLTRVGIEVFKKELEEALYESKK